MCFYGFFFSTDLYTNPPPLLGSYPPFLPAPLFFFFATYVFLRHFASTPQSETIAAEPVDFADVELAPLDKGNLRRLMHEDVLAYRPELRSPAAGSSLPEPVSHTGGREAARDGKHGSSRTSANTHSQLHHGGSGSNGTSAEPSHVSSRVANGGGQRERSSRSDRDGRGSSSNTGAASGRSGSGTGRSAAAAAAAAAQAHAHAHQTQADNGMVGSSSRADGGRSHAAARVRSGGAVARHPFPTEG